MALPTLDKTWIFKTNVLLSSLGSAQLDYQRLILTVKNMLTSSYGWTDNTGAPTTNSHLWTVRASSNSTVADTNDNWPVFIRGTDINASVNTSTDNTLRIRSVTAYRNYSVFTVTAGASTAKTLIASDLNTAFAAAGMTTLQATVDGSNRLVISDIGGGNAYFEMDSIANGSTLGTPCGFTSGGTKPQNCLVWGASAGSPFSWVVLQQAVINPNFQVCFGTGNNSATNYYVSNTYVSPVTGFTLTGLVTTAAPNSAERRQFHDNTQWHGTGPAVFDCSVQVAMSTDGECTRVMLYRDNAMRMFWIWDKPKNPVTQWLNPSIVLMNPNSGSVTPTLYTELTDNPQVYGRIGTAWAPFYVTTEFYGAAALGENIVFPNQLTGEYMLTPVGLACVTPGFYGRHAEIFDLWFASAGMTLGVSFPDSGDRQFLCLPNLVHPWNRSSLVSA